MPDTWISRGALFVSLAVHGWLLVAVPQVEAELPPQTAPTLVEFTVPPEPEPEPEVEPEPQIPPIPALQPSAEPEPVLEPEMANESPPPELTGTTLIAEGEGPFSAELGSGRARRGAIRAGLSRPAPKKRVKKRTVAPKKPAPPSAVPLAQLSKKPVPPNLGGALKRNYPKQARKQGRTGEAKVRARIEPSGSIRLAKISFESASGFGDACRRTLLSSKWTPPVDRRGKPVATWVSYRCKFRID